MKRKADINPYYIIEKKNSSLKIYDLHIQKAEGFYIKNLKSKYIFYNQTFVSDIIKSEKLFKLLNISSFVNSLKEYSIIPVIKLILFFLRNS